MLPPLHFTRESPAWTHSFPFWLFLAQLRPLNTRAGGKGNWHSIYKTWQPGLQSAGLTQPHRGCPFQLSPKPQGLGWCQALSLCLLQSFFLKILLFLTCCTSQTDSLCLLSFLSLSSCSVSWKSLWIYIFFLPGFQLISFILYQYFKFPSSLTFVIVCVAFLFYGCKLLTSLWG